MEEVSRLMDGELASEEVVAIAGPSISDNALIVAPLCDDARIPAINFSGGERTRSAWMFHYQVGSLEEEPVSLAAWSANVLTVGALVSTLITDEVRFVEVVLPARSDGGVEKVK